MSHSKVVLCVCVCACGYDWFLQESSKLLVHLYVYMFPFIRMHVRHLFGLLLTNDTYVDSLLSHAISLTGLCRLI